MVDRVGQYIDDYRLIRLLGAGAFGEVYLGEHVRDQSQVAVKTLQLTQENLRGFIKEASTAFRLRHPHIVQLLSFGISADDTPYLIMAYASNGTLRERHPKGAHLALNTVISYLLPLASALQYAHDRRVVHRDVKPENVLIGPSGEVLLSDFGIAVPTFPPGFLFFTYRHHSGFVEAVAWSPDGKRIASASGDHTVQVWDASTGTNLLTYRHHSDYVRAVVWSPDRQHIASGSWDDTVQIWDATNGSPVVTHTLQGRSGVNTVTWSPIDKRLASGGYDQIVQVWDASTGDTLLTYKGHMFGSNNSFSVQTVAWSPTGKFIASGGGLIPGCMSGMPALEGMFFTIRAFRTV